VPKKEPTIDVKFTRRELDLLFTEMNAAVENGAVDPDYPVVRDKAQRARIELIRRSTKEKR
jgi:hypothetical protein